MRMTHISAEQAQIDFAKRAAEAFAAEPKMFTFGDLKPGSLLAMRYGLGDDCVVVMRLDPDHEPVNYQQLIRVAGNVAAGGAA